MESAVHSFVDRLLTRTLGDFYDPAGFAPALQRRP